MRLFVLPILLSTFALGAFADTSLVLNKSGVAASLDTQRVTVPEGERVVLSIPVLSGNVWFKDGAPLPAASSRVLIIDSARPSDSGRYKVGYAGIQSQDSQEVVLTVVPGEGLPRTSKLLAFTTRALAGSGRQALVAGFVIGEGDETSSAKTRLLIRAVGPTLETLGETGVLSTPKLAIYDATGAVLSSTTTDPLELAQAQLQTGAFPLESGKNDAWSIVRVAPEAYSALVSSGGQAPGIVLLEVYELP